MTTFRDKFVGARVGGKSARSRDDRAGMTTPKNRKTFVSSDGRLRSLPTLKGVTRDTQLRALRRATSLKRCAADCFFTRRTRDTRRGGLRGGAPQR